MKQVKPGAVIAWGTVILKPGDLVDDNARVIAATPDSFQEPTVIDLDLIDPPKKAAAKRTTKAKD